MPKTEYELSKLFQKFINDSYKGKRIKADGTRIKRQTIRNYEYVLSYISEFETFQGEKVTIRILKGNNRRAFLSEKKYWQRFYQNFSSFLYNQKHCYDNYVGSVMKTLRVFFNYINRDMGLAAFGFHKSFYVCKEEIPIITLLPEQLHFLINNELFREKLNISLEKARRIFVFGCTTGLRVSDLLAVRFTDIEHTSSGYYLAITTEKTKTQVRIKLPDYAIEIIKQFKRTCKKRKTIFPPVPSTRFNKQIKEIAELAGWTQEVVKHRSVRGKTLERKVQHTDKSYRFCDLLSSHTMRRTAITTMLMLGMKEEVVRKISGHSNHSKSFYRYVNYSQSFIDNEVEKVFSKLVIEQ